MFKLKTTTLAFTIILALSGCTTEKDTSGVVYNIPTFTFSESTLSVSESQGSGVIKIPVTVPGSVKDDFLSASDENSDYTLSAQVTTSYVNGSAEDIVFGSLIFSESIDDPYFLLPYTVYDDSIDESTELIRLNLVADSSVGIASGSISTLTISIIDNDDPLTLRFDKTQFTASEGETVDVTISIARPLDESSVVPITFSGDAIIDSDFTVGQPIYTYDGTTDGSGEGIDLNEDSYYILIPANTQSVTVPVAITSDAKDEAGEVVIIALGESSVFEVDATPSKLFIYGQAALNDTGVTNFSDGSVIQGLQANPIDYPLQDAAFGRDVTSARDLLKLDASGNIIDPSITDTDIWRCTFDNVTKKVWMAAGNPDYDGNGLMDSLEQSVSYIDNQGATQQYIYPYHLVPSRLSDSDNTMLANYKYRYYDSEFNGGFSGELGDSVASPDLIRSTSSEPYSLSSISTQDASRNCGNPISQSSFSCDSSTLISYANQIGYCGFNNWRLPKINELLGEVSYKLQSDKPLSHIFPHFKDGNILSTTTSPIANASVFCVSADGDVKSCQKRSYNAVRLVHSIDD